MPCPVATKALVRPGPRSMTGRPSGRKVLVFRAAELGFDLRLRRVAVAIEVTVPEGAARRRGGGPTQDVALVRTELLRTVREVFADPQDIVAGAAPGWVGVLHRVPARRRTELVADCRRVVDVIAAQDGLTARVGIGEPASSVGGLHDSYQDACDALRLGVRSTGDSPVQLIADLRVHQVLAAVNQSARNRLVDLTTAELRAQPETVVYRMNKIEQITGRPLREHRTTMALHLACLADRMGSD